MRITTTFVSRYVADHTASVQWYATLFGREPDGAPMDSCREWHEPGGVIFQVLHDPDRAGEQSFAFAVDDLDAYQVRVAESGLETGEPWDVPGFDSLRYVPLADPEGVETGLLNQGLETSLPTRAG